jgi:hypothetical protein
MDKRREGEDVIVRGEQVIDEEVMFLETSFYKGCKVLLISSIKLPRIQRAYDIFFSLISSALWAMVSRGRSRTLQ